MSEMNGNEEYYLMSGRFLPHSQQPGTIYAGDLVLQGSDCLVVFYETFSSSYNYTWLGSLDNAAGFAALGHGRVEVTFQME